MRGIIAGTATAALMLLGAAVASGAAGGGSMGTDSGVPIGKRLAKYTTVRLTTDMKALGKTDAEVLPLFIDAAREMDAIFWKQAYGDKEALLSSIKDDGLRRYVEINYGPWDRLEDNEPFVPGTAAKPAGATFYPADMTKDEFEKAAAAAPRNGAALKSLYTVVRRDKDRTLMAIPYSQAYSENLGRAADLMKQAAGRVADPGLKRYLQLRAEALVSDRYQPSDFAWLEMRDNVVDLVIGPIETYEDQLFGYKASFEAYVLVKDREWSRRLARYASLLPDLQKGLPVPAVYKKESPGTDSELNAYDVVYYAGDCNAGSKTIAINLPNDEQVQLAKGTRRLQLKNAMRAKFDKILVPIADKLIAADQQSHITFDAFFANTMFHEVAHGLGIKNTVTGKGTVRDALKERAASLEEGKADILGLYMIGKLQEMGELTDGELRDNYVTFMAGIFRSVRFGAASAHGRANAVAFNFFEKAGAFGKDPATGLYRVDFEKMRAAVGGLSEKILRLQGDGDYDDAGSFSDQMGVIHPGLQASLDGLASSGIPVDVVFEQGTSVLR